MTKRTRDIISLALYYFIALPTCALLVGLFAPKLWGVYALLLLLPYLLQAKDAGLDKIKYLNGAEKAWVTLSAVSALLIYIITMRFLCF